MASFYCELGGSSGTVDPQPAIIGQSFALLCCGWIAALGLKPGATVVTIASGDCNALAYLAAGPQAVHAIDLNGTHLATIFVAYHPIRSGSTGVFLLESTWNWPL
jgi:hypothetical protein